MIAFRFLLILFFISITQISFAQTPNEKYKDSLIQEININNDSVFYIELISTIEDNGRLEKSAKIEIIDVAISRVTLLNYELTNAKLYFLKSIYKTIEGDYTAAIQLLQPNLQIFENYKNDFGDKLKENSVVVSKP